MNLNVETQVGARFKIVVRKAATDEITQETDWFCNLVLDTGLTRMVNGTWIDRCVVGSGNSTPAVGQTALDNFIAATTTTAAGTSDSAGRNVAAAPYYWWARRTWRFNTGTATGNLSEIGMGWGNTSLWNRALIKDINGNPTTITVLSDEYVDVVSEVRVYPQDNITGTFNMVDKFGATISTHTYTARPLVRAASEASAGWFAGKVNWYRTAQQADWWLVSASAMPDDVVTTIPSAGGKLPSGSTATGSSVKATVQVSSSELIFTHRSFEMGITDLMCISGATNSRISHCGYKMEIDPPINKTSNMILTYSYTLTMGRYTP